MCLSLGPASISLNDTGEEKGLEKSPWVNLEPAEDARCPARVFALASLLKNNYQPSEKCRSPSTQKALRPTS